MKANNLADISPAKREMSLRAQLALGLLLVSLSPSSFLLAQTLQSKTPGILNPLSSDSVSSTTAPALSTSNTSVLPVDEAFALTAVIEGDRNLVLSWAIQPGYYLYQDKLTLLDSQGQPLALDLPPAIALTDEFFGETQVYFDELRLSLPLSTAGLRANDGKFALDLRFQGCAKDRYCYPPQQKALQLSLPL